MSVPPLGSPKSWYRKPHKSHQSRAQQLLANHLPLGDVKLIARDVHQTPKAGAPSVQLKDCTDPFDVCLVQIQALKEIDNTAASTQVLAKYWRAVRWNSISSQLKESRANCGNGGRQAADVVHLSGMVRKGGTPTPHGPLSR